MGYMAKPYMAKLYKPLFILFILLFFIFQHTSIAIPLRLKNGNPLEGKLVSVEGNRINFESNGMILTLPIERIIAPDTEWFDQAESLLNQGDYSNAYEYCRQLLIWDPDHIKAMELRKLILQKQDEEKKETARIAEEKKREEELKILEQQEQAKQVELSKQAAEAEKQMPYEIIKKVAETYKKMTSYYFEINLTTEMIAPGMQQKYDIPVTFAAIRPGKFRTEIKSQFMEMLIVSNGEFTWMYFPQMKQYTKMSGSLINEKISGDKSSSSNTDELISGISQFETIGDNVKEAKILREETILVGDKSIHCYVIRIEEKEDPNESKMLMGPAHIWVNKDNFIILKFSAGGVVKGSQIGMKTTGVISSFKVNQSIPDNLFSFTPPPNSKEMGSGSRRQSVDLTGKKAIDFTLDDLKGNKINLNNLQGKVVVLDFWASWCPPCRKELPILENLHREYKDRGLVVLGINDEEIKTAREYVNKTNLTFATLSDSENYVSQSYQVDAIPTVVIIGRDGKIIKHFIGAKSENELRTAINDAGIK